MYVYVAVYVTYLWAKKTPNTNLLYVHNNVHANISHAGKIIKWNSLCWHILNFILKSVPNNTYALMQCINNWLLIRFNFLVFILIAYKSCSLMMVANKQTVCLQDRMMVKIMCYELARHLACTSIYRYFNNALYTSKSTNSCTSSSYW